MKEKTINKTLKLVLIFAILIIVGLLFYYFVIFLPYKEQVRIEEKRQADMLKCLDEVESIYLETFKKLLDVQNTQERIESLESLEIVNETWQGQCYKKYPID